jgi:hypothetical protein
MRARFQFPSSFPDWRDVTAFCNVDPEHRQRRHLERDGRRLGSSLEMWKKDRIGDKANHGNTSLAG